MKEYEYSFKVDSLDKYIDYCKNNNYELVEQNNQIRTLYRNSNKTMARVTEKNNEKYLDFKEDNLTDDILKERRESLPLKFDNIEEVESILEFLEYKKDITLNRERIVYEKGDVKFELDRYLKPEVYNVVAIEGNKEKVDKIYEEIKEQ